MYAGRPGKPRALSSFFLFCCRGRRRKWRLQEGAGARAFALATVGDPCLPILLCTLAGTERKIFFDTDPQHRAFLVSNNDGLIRPRRSNYRAYSYVPNCKILVLSVGDPKYDVCACAAPLPIKGSRPLSFSRAGRHNECPPNIIPKPCRAAPFSCPSQYGLNMRPKHTTSQPDTWI